MRTTHTQAAARDAPPRRPLGPRKPTLLIVHDDPTVVRGLKGSLETTGHLAVETVRDEDAALERIAAGEGRTIAVLLQWDHPRLRVPRLVAALRSGRYGPAPVVMAMSECWAPEDVTRADSVGVVSFLVPPVRVHQLLTELVAARHGERTASHAAALEAVGRATPAGPGNADPEWRSRMVELAASAPRRNGARRAERVRQLLERLDEAVGGALDLAHAEALMLLVRRDERQLAHLVEAGCVDRALIETLYDIILEFVGVPASSPSARASVHAWLGDLTLHLRARRGQGDWSPGFEALRVEARRMLVNGTCDDPRAPESEAFRDHLGGLLGVDPGYLLELDVGRVRRIARRIEAEPLEDRALDFARLIILAYILKARRLARADRDDASDGRALAALFGRSGSAAAPADLMARLRSLSDELASEADADELADLPDPHELRALFATWESLDDDRAPHCGPATPPPGGPVASSAAAELFGRLAAHLELPRDRVLGWVTMDVLSRVPRSPLRDIRVPGPVATCLRLAAGLVASTADANARNALLAAVARRHDGDPRALAAMLRFLEEVAGASVVRHFRALVGLDPDPPTVPAVRALLAAGDGPRALLASYDLPDDAPGVADLLEDLAGALADRLPRPEVKAIHRRVLRIDPSRLGALRALGRGHPTAA